MYKLVATFRKSIFTLGCCKTVNFVTWYFSLGACVVTVELALMGMFSEGLWLKVSHYCYLLLPLAAEKCGVFFMY
jgi:hypothetical protein